MNEGAHLAGLRPQMVYCPYQWELCQVKLCFKKPRNFSAGIVAGASKRGLAGGKLWKNIAEIQKARQPLLKHMQILSHPVITPLAPCSRPRRLCSHQRYVPAHYLKPTFLVPSALKRNPMY